MIYDCESLSVCSPKVAEYLESGGACETLACSDRLELQLAPAVYRVIPSVLGGDQSALRGSTEKLQLCRLLETG